LPLHTSTPIVSEKVCKLRVFEEVFSGNENAVCDVACVSGDVGLPGEQRSSNGFDAISANDQIRFPDFAV
jgi:hypothetical protein